MSKRWASKEERDLAQYAESLGYAYDRTRGGHCRFFHPAVGAVIASTHSRPCDVRSTKVRLRRSLALQAGPALP